MKLSDLGWNVFFENSFRKLEKNDLIPARVSRSHGQKCMIYGTFGESVAEVSGKFLYNSFSSSDLPTVGDWVAVQHFVSEQYAIIHHLLPRKNSFSRKFPGKSSSAQILSANTDTIFITCGLDHEFNTRRIERYLTMALEHETEPVILLNKADICPDLDGCCAEAESVAVGAPVVPISAMTGEGFGSIRAYGKPGKTSSFLGSSGVGKSSIINRLLGKDKQQIQTVRERDSRGRHTTTYREMIILPEGGLIIDNPGMRELQPYKEEEGIGDAFKDIEGFSTRCRFRDCKHEGEPDCAVHMALSEGLIDHHRFENYLQLKKEARYLAEKQKMNPKSLERARWKKISKLSKKMKKLK